MSCKLNSSLLLPYNAQVLAGISKQQFADLQLFSTRYTASNAYATATVMDSIIAIVAIAMQRCSLLFEGILGIRGIWVEGSCGNTPRCHCWIGAFPFLASTMVGSG